VWCAHLATVVAHLPGDGHNLPAAQLLRPLRLAGAAGATSPRLGLRVQSEEAGSQRLPAPGACLRLRRRGMLLFPQPVRQADMINHTGIMYRAIQLYVLHNQHIQQTIEPNHGNPACLAAAIGWPATRQMTDAQQVREQRQELQQFGRRLRQLTDAGASLLARAPGGRPGTASTGHPAAASAQGRTVADAPRRTVRMSSNDL
jgi:hypothetical protein